MNFGQYLQKFFRHSLHLSVIFFVAACGATKQRSSSINVASGSSPRPLLVALSGYSTCDNNVDSLGDSGPVGSRLYGKARIAATEIESVFGVTPAVIVSCFTSSRTIMAISSKSNWTVTAPGEAEFLADTLNQILEATHAYVIGHSYGGWLAMKLMESFQDGNLGLVKALFTIDPISKTNCTFSSPLGCFSAPSDILPETRQRIREKADLWANSWQDTTSYLHSSSIQQATRNRYLPLSHLQILDSEEIWSDFKDQFKL